MCRDISFYDNYLLFAEFDLLILMTGMAARQLATQLAVFTCCGRSVVNSGQLTSRMVKN